MGCLLSLTAAVRTCNECFLKNVAWDPQRTYDVFGPDDGKPVVLVHGALIGRHCMVQEAKALAEAGYRCVCRGCVASNASQVPRLGFQGVEVAVSCVWHHRCDARTAPEPLARQQ
jgi:pimeloyl-ACP methyl ester carboxylesterase